MPSAQTSAAATVEFRHVTKRYGAGAAATTAVDDLSFEVPAGKICVFVGPSGAGKTTTLKMVNRLIEPTSGQILIDGHDVLADDPTALRRRIGYVIQQVGLLPHLTIGDNVATVPQLLGWPQDRGWPLASTSCSTWSDCRRRPTATGFRRSCRVASANASALRGRWPPTRR